MGRLLTEIDLAVTAAFELEVYLAAAATFDEDEYLRSEE